MTIRTRFNLIAVVIVLPSFLAMAGYFYSARSDFSDPKQIAAASGTREWATRLLRGEHGSIGELPPGIAAMAVRRADGVVAFSNVEGLAKGETVSPGRLLDRAGSAYPGLDFVAESISGEPGGGYVAVIRPAAGAWYLDPYIIGTGVVLSLECLAVIIGIVLMLRTSSSILALGEAAKRVASGDLEFSLEGRGKDEVGLLYRAFDGMRRDLVETRDGRARFLMGVSHDLRTPLTSIKGYLQALDDGLEKSPAMRKKFLAILRTKAELLESRIQELIEFASLETAVWRAKLVELGLKDFLEGVAEAAALDAEASGRKFAFRIRVSPGTTVKADPRLFLHVLENLVSNAMRYSGSSGSVALEADEDDSLIAIVVRDDGPGIPEKDRARVFEDFFRGTGARNDDGLGLGLSIVKSVVTAHGWNVCLSEDSTVGTSFVISIPKPPPS